jgi:glycosyltransferase involved in cell wall biosynthesis
MKKTLSVIIPTYNEEDFIGKALFSVQFADEIIIVDSFSTDKTVEIAKSYNCKIIEREFDNFSNQKNHALQYATKDWVLFLDADERVPYKLHEEIKSVIEKDDFTAYKIKFPHFYMTRFLYHHYDKVTRLVKRGYCEYKGDVHEKLIVNGKVSILKNEMLHFTYKGLMHYISKKDKYAWFQANQLLRENKKVTYFHLIFKPCYRFFNSYILRRAFLDGIPGLAVAGINAYGVFSRYAKLLLLQKGLE